jgi:hypothetical protein
MKKAILVVVTAFTALLGQQSTANAQSVDSTRVDTVVTKVDSSLYRMTKMQLTKMYLDEVTKLAFNAPYTPFTIGVNDTIHGELDIPVSKYTARKRDRIMEMSKAYGNLMEEQLYELVPYSDKNDIIRAILFVREMNNNINNK